MRKLSIVVAAVIAIAVSRQPSSAQSPNLTFPLFERYIESFRKEAGIPAISAVIVQNGVRVWERGFGLQDVQAAIAAQPDTPYPIGTLTQAIGSTLVLKKCLEESYAELTDKVVRWTPLYPEPLTTIGELLSHTAPNGTYQYAPARFSALTGVVEECGKQNYAQQLAHEFFDRLSMLNSVPGQALANPTPEDMELFEPARLSQYASVLSRVAVPYRVIKGRATRNISTLPQHLNVATGIVTSARDLAQFDIALDTLNLLLTPETRALAFTQVFSGGTPFPTSLGWFVQSYNNQLVVWQFGLVENAYSSLILKVPNRGLALILLANSDGLTAPFALEAGDVTASIFAKTFLRTFVP